MNPLDPNLIREWRLEVNEGGRNVIAADNVLSVDYNLGESREEHDPINRNYRILLPPIRRNGRLRITLYVRTNNELGSYFSRYDTLFGRAAEEVCLTSGNLRIVFQQARQISYDIIPEESFYSAAEIRYRVELAWVYSGVQIVSDGRPVDRYQIRIDEDIHREFRSQWFQEPHTTREDLLVVFERELGMGQRWAPPPPSPSKLKERERITDWQTLGF